MKYDVQEYKAIATGIEEQTETIEVNLTPDQLRTYLLGTLDKHGGDSTKWLSGLGIDFGENLIRMRANVDVSPIEKNLFSRLPFKLSFPQDTASIELELAPQLENKQAVAQIRGFKVGKLGLPVGRLLSILSGMTDTVPSEYIKGDKFIVPLENMSVQDFSLSEEEVHLTLVEVN
jgi:hypothetical protein